MKQTFAAATSAEAMERALNDAFAVVFGTYGRTKVEQLAPHQATKTAERRLDEVIETAKEGSKVRGMLEMLRDGATPRQVADHYGISPDAVRNALHAKGVRMGAILR